MSHWLHGSALPGLLSKLSASQFGCDLQLLLAFCFLLLFLCVILRAPSFCCLTRQLHLAPSSTHSVSWFPPVSLPVCQLGAYRTALLLFAIIRNGVLYGPFIWNFLQDYKALPAVVLSLPLRLFIPACPSSQMASSCNKGTTWKLSIYGTVLECSLLQYCISFASAYSCLSLFSTEFSMLWAWPPFLCLFINPMSLGQVLALGSLYKPSDSLLSWPLLKYRISPIFPAFSFATSWASQQSQNIFFQFQLSIAVNL